MNTPHKHDRETLKNHGTTQLSVSFQGNTIRDTFYIVAAPEELSILGCRQSQKLGIVTNASSIHAVSETSNKCVPTSQSNLPLTQEGVKKEYSDCFDKI